MTLRRFEELSTRQAARKLVQAVYAASSNRGIWDSGLRDQIRRAALSTMANIAEGFHLGYLDDREFRNLFDQAEDIARQISGLVSHLNRHA